MARCNEKPQIAPVSPAWRAEMDVVARALENQYGLPGGLLSRLMALESRYDPVAFNPCTGALGIAQVKPIFVQDMAGRFRSPFDPLNPRAALAATARYLAWVHRRTGSLSWSLPLMAYNWGEGNMSTWRGARSRGINALIPRETIAYIAAIAPEA